MNKNKLLMFVSLLVAATMMLSSCAPAATPTTAPATAAPEATATTAPAMPTATTAPAMPTATTAPAAPTNTAAPAGPAKGGTLVVSNAAGNYNTMDPFVSPWHDIANYSAYDTILAIKPDYTGYVGDLVDDKWDVAKDNLSVTFHVKPNLKFQDGTAVDAAALKWNLDHWTDAKVAAPGGGNLQGVYASSEAPDAATLVVKLKTPYAPLYNELASLEMVSPTAYQALGPDKFSQAPIGAGPYKISKIAPNDSITYDRYDAYNWAPSFLDNKGPVLPDHLVVKYVADDQTAFAAFQTGEINVIQSIPAQFLDKAKSDPNMVIVKGQEAGGEYLGFNTQFKPFDDPKVRVAISYAINRDEIIQVGFNGEAVPMYSNLASSELGYSQAQEDYGKSVSNNVDTAKKMLADLGYKAGADGILVGKDGKKMQFKLSTTNDDYRQRIAQDIQAQLKDIGIQVDIDIKDSAVVRQMTIDGTHQMILWGYGLIDPNILTYLFASDRVGKSNRTRFVNKDLDKMLVEADSQLDLPTRMKDVDAILKFLVDQRPNIPLFSKYQYAGYRKDIVAGLKFDKSGAVIIMDAYITKQ